MSREIAPADFGVVTVGSLQAGAKSNVIPDRAVLLLNIAGFTGSAVVLLWADSFPELLLAVITYAFFVGPIVALVISGAGCIDGFRSLAGATNPTVAAPGSIRGDLARDWGNGRIENLVHGSDSHASAEREIPIWFTGLSH